MTGAARLLAALLMLAAGAARAELPAGDGRIAVAEPAGATGEAMPVWFHRPAGWGPAGRVVVVMHGVQRDADRYRDEWARLSEAGGFLLLVPEFSKTKFPGVRWYNFGNVVDEQGRPVPAQDWTFPAFERVVHAAMREAGAARTGFILYGHSAGAQFVHRYLLLTGAPAAERVIIANAGSYTLPVFDRPFPEGLGGTAARPETLRAVLARPVVLQLGEADTDPKHPSLPSQPWAVAQGSHRLARGWFFFDTVRRIAAAEGAPFGWRVVTVPGVAHSNAGMGAAAAATLFAD